MLHWLTGLLRDGATLVTDVPGESGAVEEVVGLFGHVWETNYGRLFDVRTEADPNNLAFTSRALPPHTDNPYRDPVPSLQVLHCLTDDGAGGDTVLVDGFFVAEQLREKDVDAFRWLTRPVTFRYRAGNAHLENRVPVIDVDDNDALRAVHVNHRSFHPVELSAEEQGPYYEAYRWFHQLLQAPDTGRRFHLAPGQAMVFHNHRLLHARTALAATGARHLQGCYAHHHEALSTWRILNAAVKGDLHGQ